MASPDKYTPNQQSMNELRHGGYQMDKFGLVTPTYDVAGMGSPVLCRCGKVYDLMAVHPIGRFAECTTYRTPCCDIQTDDREWVSSPSFRRLDCTGRVVVRGR